MKSGLKYRMVEIIPQNRINKKIKIKKNADIFRHLWNNIRCNNIPIIIIIGVLEGEDKEKNFKK